mgnify:CR=1 FL=1
MIAVVIIWFVIGLVTSGLGLLFSRHFLLIADAPIRHDFLVMNAFVGMSILIPLLAIFSIAIRLNGELLCLFIAIALGILYAKRQFLLLQVLPSFKDFSWGHLIGIALLPLMLLLMYGILNPGSIGDTLLYHAQCIQWSEKYKAIPGLAHIHNRLAFNNHSLLPFALFGFSFTDIQTFYCVNSFLMFLLTMKCTLEMTVSFRKNNLSNLFFYATILISTYFLIGEKIASPAPDNTAAIYLIYCVILFKEIIKDERKELLPILYLMAFLLPTIKVSTVFVAVLPVLASWQEKLYMNSRHWGLVVGLGVFTVFPYFARNMILSGYLIFPFPLDLFNFDWQYFDAARLEMMNKYIINAARITGPHDAGLWTYDMSLAEWFPHWLTWRTPQYYFMNFVLPLCLLFSGYSLVMNFIKKSKTDFFYNSFSIFFYISFLYWLFSAPDFRFIWGTMISGFAIISYYLFDKFNVTNTRLKSVLSVASLVYFIFAVYQVFDLDVLSKHIKLPVKIKEIEVKAGQYGPIAINIPSSRKLGGLCYNAPIPCTHHVHDAFEARGSKISHGFRMNPALKKKKKQKKKNFKHKKLGRDKANSDTNE